MTKRLIPAVMILITALFAANCGRNTNITGPSPAASTLTPTTTCTSSAVQTSTATFPATEAPTASTTSTAIVTQTFTPTQTFTYTITPTDTETGTPEDTYTQTETDTCTPTVTLTATPTFTATPTHTQTSTSTATPTITNTYTATPTSTGTFTVTRTATQTATCTVTPTVTPGLFVKFASGGMVVVDYRVTIFWMTIEGTGFGVQLRQNNEQGLPILNAAVDFEGNTLTDVDGIGNYRFMELSHLYSPGDTVNMTINTGIGSTSSSLIMPDAATVTFPARGATLNPDVDNLVCWYYPAAQPPEINIGVASSLTDTAGVYLDQNLPGSTRYFIIPAGTLPAGRTNLMLGVGGITYTTLNNVEPGSNSFSVRNAGGVLINTQ